MKFSLVFDNSGDSIPFVALNPEVVEYYIDQLNQRNLNSFCPNNRDYATTIDSVINELDQGLQDTNCWLTQLFDQTFETFDHDNYLDQSNLNYLHATWVGIQSLRLDIDCKRIQTKYCELIEQIHDMYPDDERFPLFGDVVDKIEKKKIFDRLNLILHSLESSFSDVKFRCSDNWIEFDNPFPKNIINNDTCNLFLPFRHLGRSCYEKFVHFDHNLEHDDENTFNELLGFVSLDLGVPQQKGFSKEYVSWCNTHGVEPSGEKLPLGNIPDLLTNLTKYRIIVFNNIIANNKFHINLHKG